MLSRCFTDYRFWFLLTWKPLCSGSPTGKTRVGLTWMHFITLHCRKWEGKTLVCSICGFGLQCKHAQYSIAHRNSISNLFQDVSSSCFAETLKIHLEFRFKAVWELDQVFSLYILFYNKVCKVEQMVYNHNKKPFGTILNATSPITPKFMFRMS